MIRLKDILNERTKGSKVICDKCSWQWDISDGGKEPFKCHKCGNDNTPMNEDNKRIPREKGQHKDSSSHSDLFTDENPKGTIRGLKFATVEDAEDSVKKIKSSGKSHAHKIQAAVAMEQRAKSAGKPSAAGIYRTYINSIKKSEDSVSTNIGEDLRKWFNQKWVNIGKKKDGKHPPCGTSGKKSGYAKCVPAAKAAGMSKKEKESATRRKRAAQNDAGRGGSNSGGQGKTPIYVSTKKNEEWSDKYKSSIDCSNPKGFSQKAHCQGKKKNENMKTIEERLGLFLEKNIPNDPAKWAASKAAAKRKFDVYPSAYANGWAAKNYKGKGGTWKTGK